ncbi:metallopeptidase family protein [Nocardioides mangrovicus]|uniref:metallopeptidase family protein n=1 Tax=Nocardioides mangrovicus TaxID=2478913 RepID=UPI001E335419|nr:metallopeptidase family protein [Nocardioides mangrovicus]
MRGIGRDRHGRGRRGPDLLPTPLAPDGVPRDRTRGEAFDALALAVLEDLEERYDGSLPPLDLAVEEIPVLPPDWSSSRVPLGSQVAPRGPDPARIVLFRRPIEHRAESRADLAAVVLAVIVEQVSELTGIAPHELHPDYPDDED